jgi:hypothetical protein
MGSTRPSHHVEVITLREGSGSYSMITQPGPVAELCNTIHTVRLHEHKETRRTFGTKNQEITGRRRNITQ